MNPQLLEILTQRDFLEASEYSIRRRASLKMQDGLNLLSPTYPLDADVCYSRITHLCKNNKSFEGNFFVMARNFLIQSMKTDAEWEGLLKDFKEKSLVALKKASEAGYIQSEMKSCFQFYCASNLDPAVPGVPPPGQAVLEQLTSVLDSAVAQLHGTSFLEKNRTMWRLVNHHYLAETVDDEKGNEILTQYRRLVFEAESGGELKLAPTILGGVHAFQTDADGSRPTPAKVSFIEPKIETINEQSIQELSALINSKVTKEPDLQRYFEQYPSLLCEDSSYRIYPQIVLERDDGTTLRPDFFLEPVRLGLERLPIIIDLKLPTEDLILNQQNRSRFYSKIYQYAAQLREYCAYFDSPSNRRRVEECYGIRALRPRLVLIVGKDYAKSDYALIDRINRSISPVEVKTYDEILRFGQSLLAKKSLAVNSGAVK